VGAARPDRARDRRDLRRDPERQHHLRIGIFGAFTIFDFNRLRRSGTDDAVQTAASIFLDLFNVFLLALELFGGQRD